MKTEILEELGKQELARQAEYRRRIFCCTSTACISAGAAETQAALEQAVAGCGCGEHETEVVHTGCMGLCSRGPLVRVETQGQEAVLYGSVTPAVAEEIVSRHVLPCGNEDGVDPQKHLDSDLGKHHIPLNLPFFTKQVRIVLSETGRIDPEKLEDYLANGGYQGLIRAMRDLTPELVCDEIVRSGLRGRGGAGFPTGTKWNFVRREKGPSKFVIVNGDEGDPGAYMDRTVMEDDPHRVLEGMIICAYAVGASYGYLYIRGEYPAAIQRVKKAILAARRRGILGKSVLQL
jgi:bidirectional [NiFe] hydrogenase diaphorase subunit